MKVKDLCFIAICTALIAVCSWISIPSTVPFTLQTFAVFLTLTLLGGKKGTLSILLYILLGLVGVPVFANFNAGPGALLGATGGYIVAFLVIGLVYILVEKFFGTSFVAKLIAFIIGTVLCYALGTLWFVHVYTANKGPIDYAKALSICVIPFIIPDAIKLLLALLIGTRVKPAIDKLKF